MTREFLILVGLASCGGLIGIDASTDASSDSSSTHCPGYTLGTTSIVFSNVAEAQRAVTEESRAVGELQALDARLSGDVLIACRNIGTDIGATTPMNESAIEWCKASKMRLQSMGLAFTASPMAACTPSKVELDACAGRCNSAPLCDGACSAISQLRGTCEKPQLTIQITGTHPQLTLVQKTLEANLPAVMHAYAHSRLWVAAVEGITKTSALLTPRLDLLGLGCVGLLADDVARIVRKSTFLNAVIELVN